MPISRFRDVDALQIGHVYHRFLRSGQVSMPPMGEVEHVHFGSSHIDICLLTEK